MYSILLVEGIHHSDPILLYITNDLHDKTGYCHLTKLLQYHKHALYLHDIYCLTENLDL